jgi:hypothetical protein
LSWADVLRELGSLSVHQSDSNRWATQPSIQCKQTAPYGPSHPPKLMATDAPGDGADPRGKNSIDPGLADRDHTRTDLSETSLH